MKELGQLNSAINALLEPIFGTTMIVLRHVLKELMLMMFLDGVSSVTLIAEHAPLDSNALLVMDMTLCSRSLMEDVIMILTSSLRFDFLTITKHLRFQSQEWSSMNLLHS